MKQAIEGVYSEGKVTLNESVPYKGEAKVLVVFLEDYKEKSDRNERLMKTFGSWDDNRATEQIIDDVYSSRVTRRDDISL